MLLTQRVDEEYRIRLPQNRWEHNKVPNTKCLRHPSMIETYSYTSYLLRYSSRGVIVGEGKPENQNHAVIFAHGEALQTVDMNQDNHLTEALKMRNLLMELRPEKKGA